MRKKTIIKVVIIGLIIATLLWINRSFLEIRPNDIRGWILSFGWFAPILYIILYTVRPLILFPASILSLAGGLAFGAVYGTIYTIIGATGGAILSFLVARKLGANLAKKPWTGKAEAIQQQLEKRGFMYVVVLRLIPIFNFDLISYVAGVSKVKFRAFALGTLLGIIPGTFAYTFLGASFVDGDLTTILIAVALFVAVSLIPLMTSQKVKDKFGIGSTKKE